MKYYCLLSILLFSLIACGSNDDKEPQSEDVTIKCSPEKIEAVYHALNEQYEIGRNNGYSEWYRYADPLYLNWTEEATLKLLYNKKNMTEYFRQNLLKIIEIVANKKTKGIKYKEINGHKYIKNLTKP